MEALGEQARELTVAIAREESEQFRIDARDFLSARERGGTTGTRIDQQTAALSDAAEIVNRSFPTLEPSGRFINAISPVVIPNRQSLFWRLMPIGMMVVFFVLGLLIGEIARRLIEEHVRGEAAAKDDSSGVPSSGTPA